MPRPGLRSAILLAFALAPALRAADAGSPFGVNVHAPTGAHLRLLLDRTAEAGIGWVRIDFIWAAVEPQPGVEHWRLYDEIVAEARARNLQVLALVAYTPAWATAGTEISGVPRHAADWADFCFRAASRYRGEIAWWEIWNEPNLPRFWSGSRASYIETILRPAAAAIRAADPEARVGGPALSHSTIAGRDWHGWLLEVLRAAGEELDFLTHHVYDLEDPSGVLARLSGETPFGNDPSRWAESPPSLREVLAWAGFDGPVWLTETGWVSTRLDESRQAAHYARFLELWLGDGRAPGLPARVFFYELEDSRDPQIAKYGLLRVGGTRKPAYGVLRDVIAAHSPPPVMDDPAPRPPRDPGPRILAPD